MMRRLTLNAVLLGAAIIVLSLAGLHQVAGLVGLAGMLLIVLFVATGLSRPGATGARPLGRRAHRINFLGRYGDPVTGLGSAIIVGFAVLEIVHVWGKPSWLALVAVALDLLAGSRVSRPVEWAEQAVGVAAAAVVLFAVWRSAGAIDAMFVAAVLIVVVVLMAVWFGPLPGIRLPVTLFGGGREVRLLAAFGLIELARTLAYPLGADGGRDLWADVAHPWITRTGALVLFGGITVAAAYGPRFVTGLVGLALLLAAVALVGFGQQGGIAAGLTLPAARLEWWDDTSHASLPIPDGRDLVAAQPRQVAQFVIDRASLFAIG